MIELAWGVATDTGLVRAQNEDCVLAEPPIFAVADGMGGHVAGDIASAMTIAALRVLAGRPRVSPDEVVVTIRAANAAVLEKSAESVALRGMGTTVVGLALLDDETPEFLAFNVGDSRLYRFAGGELTQLSHDHSEAQELVDEGVISESEAMVSAARHVLTRAIGTETDLHIDTWPVHATAGDRFLICSDGLTGELDDEEIARAISEEAAPSEAANRLVAEALAAGGHDNVSVIVLEVVGSGDETADAEAPDDGEPS